MRKIWSETETEFESIAGEVSHLRTSLERLRTARLDAGSQEGWEAAHICASAAEKIYSGFERVMARIVRDVDPAPVGYADGWHRSLLQRVSRPVVGRRPAILSRTCFDRLDRLRAFRHRERNTYGLDLDLGIVLERSAEVVEAFDVFRSEVTTFFDRAVGSDDRGPDVSSS